MPVMTTLVDLVLPMAESLTDLYCRVVLALAAHMPNSSLMYDNGLYDEIENIVEAAWNAKV